MDETHSADRSAASGEPADEDVVWGPHGWLNWLAAREGQPARETSHTQSALLIPLWEEYGLYSDAALVGELSLGPARFILAFPSEDSRLGEAQLVLILRVTNHLGDPTFGPLGSTEDVASYHGGGLDDEFASLLGLVLGRRLRSGGPVRQRLSGRPAEGDPFYGQHRVPRLAAPARGRSILPGVANEANLADANGPMEKYAVLSGADATTVVRAASQYADALWWAELDPRMAWIKLIGALEIAASHWADSHRLSDVQRFKRYMGLTYKRFKNQFGEAVADAVAAAWDRNAGATARFVEFTVEHAPEPPGIRPSHSQVEWADLGSALRTVYHWRSQDLHRGIPFPGPMCEPPSAWTSGAPPERFPALAASQHGGTWPAERMPIALHVFAFVVRQALMSWWAELPEV